MCGISGILSTNQLEESDKSVGRKIIDELYHRGPDHKGEFQSKNKKVFLGHNRLSIIFNQPEGNQPMEINGNVISFNGEIYNYKSLAEKYFKDIKNYGDTEILLRMWDKFGENSLKQIDGMYAFAIYDNENLYLASDYFGEKTIYYILKNNKFYFSSEIDPLINLIEKKNIDKDILKSFLCLGYLPNDKTFFSDIKKLEPNTLLIVNKNLIVNKKKIHEIDYPGDKKIIERSDQKEFEDLFLESLESRLVSDVEVALFLSSGIDSSLIAATISKEFNKDIKTVTLKNSSSDESLLAEKIASFLNLRNYIIETETIDKDLFNSATNSANDNIEIYAVNYLSKFLKNLSIKVALSGLGADELFYGYNKYAVLRKYENVNFIRKIFFKLSSLYNKNYYKINFDPSYYISLKKSQKYLYLKNSIKLNFFKSEQIEEFQNIEKKDFLKISRNFDLMQMLPNSFLPTNDIAGMRNSIEIRSPYLNIKLLRFINKFDANFLITKENKFFQRQMLQKYIPINLINKRKLGFNFSSTRLKKDFSDLKIEKSLLPYYEEINFNKSNISLTKIQIRLIMLDCLLKKNG